MIVFLLIIVAAGLSLAAQLTDTVEFGVAAVVVALSSVVLVAGRTWADRGKSRQKIAPAQSDGERDGAPDQPPTDDHEGAASAHDNVADEVDSPDDEPATAGSQEDAVPIRVVETEAEVVRVIPGRKRFHEPGCSSLVGRQSEELTRVEAEEEGFTPCSLCSSGRKSVRKVG